MKKFLCSFAFLIFLSLQRAMICKASYLPPTLPVDTVVPDFLTSVGQYSIINDSNVYMGETDLNAVNQLVNGRSIQDSINYVYIDNSSLNAELGTLYTVNGVEVSQGDTYTVYGTSDVGECMFICAKGTGEILYQGESNNLHSTLLGGDGLKESFPEFIVRDLSLSTVPTINRIIDEVDKAKTDQNCIIYGNSLTNADKEFLQNYTFYCRITTASGWTCFVPNACSTNTIVHLMSNQGNNAYEYHGVIAESDRYVIRPIVYTNNPNEVYFSGTGSGVGLIAASNNIYGKNYAYCSNTTYPFFQGGSLDCNLPSLANFQTYNAISDNVVYLVPTEVINEPDQNIYNYTYINENPPDNITNVNNHYNYEGDTNYNNYPVYNTFTYPSYPTTNTYVNNIYNYYTTPSQGDSIGQIDPENVTDNIPILSNLKYRFPFSIPFDIYNLISGLAVQREAPNFDWEITFPIINYTWEIDFDLSAWDTQAAIFRTCFLILFIIALAMWAYNHFFGN